MIHPINASRPISASKPISSLMAALFLSFGAMSTSLAAGETAPPAAKAPVYAGFDQLELKVPDRPKPLYADIWYPASGKTYKGIVAQNAIFKGVKAYIGAAIAQKKHPLVLISHGSGGSKESMAWLASQLASTGAMVLAFNHPGSSSGDSSPRRSIRHWTRPQDVSMALDALLADPLFGPLIDQKQISAAGFSLGGATVLSLAGARADLDLYKAYCETWKDRAEDCIFFQKGGVNFDHLSKEDFAQDLKDARISKFIAIDPGLTYGLTAKSLQAIAKPVLVLSLGDDKTQLIAANVTEKGSGLMQNLRKGKQVSLYPASHFTALPVCQPNGAQILREEEDDPICTDPEGTNRAEIHKKISENIAAFLSLSAK